VLLLIVNTCLTARDAAHDTSLAQEPQESDETDQRQERRGEQQEAEELCCSVGGIVFVLKWWERAHG